MSKQYHTDWELIQACRAGDESAWETLVERYGRLLHYIPLKYGLAKEDANDVVQRTLLIFVESMGSFHAESNVKGWLTTVVKRQAWQYHHKPYRDQPLSDKPLTESTKIEQEIGSFEEAYDTADYLITGLNQLNERCRTLLLKLYFELKTDRPNYKEIAAELNMPEGSVGPTRARCLKKLKTILDRDGR